MNSKADDINFLGHTQSNLCGVAFLPTVNRILLLCAVESFVGSLRSSFWTKNHCTASVLYSERDLLCFSLCNPSTHTQSSHICKFRNKMAVKAVKGTRGFYWSCLYCWRAVRFDHELRIKFHASLNCVILYSPSIV